MKTAKDFLTEANSVVPKITASDGIAKHETGTTLFIDVRDSAAIAQSGTIKGALRIPRGFMEFAADEKSQYHNPVLKRDQDIVLVCGAGGQAALCGKTMTDMGFRNVSNVGGFKDWKEAGGPVE